MSKQYIGNISSTVAGANFTFNTDLNIGEESPNRKILVFFALRTGTAESIANKVLLNNIEADIIYNKIDEQGNLHIVAYATIPGTTLNASVNLGTSYLRCVMHVYRLDNLDFLECASIMNKTTNKTTININIKPNGAILGMAVVQYSNASVNTKFSGLIKDSTLDIPYVSTMVGSTDTSEDTNVEITAQFSRTGEPKTLICVSFEEKREEMTQFGKILKGNANYNIIVKNNNNYNKIMLDNTLYWKKEYVSEETKISLKNIIINADFKDGTTGFTNYVNSTIQSVQDGYLTWIKRNSNTSGTYIYAGLSEELKPSHKYYARSIFNSTASSEFRGGIQYRGGTTTINKYGTYSSVPITTSFLDEITDQTQYVIDMQCGDTNIETLFQIKELMLVDVTELYGVIGNTDNEIKEYMDTIQFFIGEKEINA